MVKRTPVHLRMRQLVEQCPKRPGIQEEGQSETRMSRDYHNVP